MLSQHDWPVTGALSSSHTWIRSTTRHMLQQDRLEILVGGKQSAIWDKRLSMMDKKQAWHVTVVKHTRTCLWWAARCEYVVRCRFDDVRWFILWVLVCDGSTCMSVTLFRSDDVKWFISWGSCLWWAARCESVTCCKREAVEWCTSLGLSCKSVIRYRYEAVKWCDVRVLVCGEQQCTFRPPIAEFLLASNDSDFLA